MKTIKACTALLVTFSLGVIGGCSSSDKKTDMDTPVTDTTADNSNYPKPVDTSSPDYNNDYNNAYDNGTASNGVANTKNNTNDRNAYNDSKYNDRYRDNSNTDSVNTTSSSADLGNSSSGMGL